MKEAAKQRQVSRLADGDRRRKETRCQNECDGEADQIAPALIRQPRIGPHATRDYQEIRSPGRYGDDLVDVLEPAGADPREQPLNPAAEERVHKQIAVIPQSGCRNSDEVTPAAAAEGEPDRGQIHPGLEEV